MAQVRTAQVALHFSDSGCALFRPGAGARVTLDVGTGESEEMPGAYISGNREGLYALASALLAVAESPVGGFHLHIHEATAAPCFRSRDGLTLTIEKLDR